MNSIQQTIQSHWDLSNARDWDAFQHLLHPSLQYDCPQTREYIEGAFGYLEMFRTWPGDWKAQIQKLICNEQEGLSVINFEVGTEVMRGLSIFEFKDGLIAKVTDYWPEEYDPPARATQHLKRRSV
jgi:hypothetical protein